MTIKTIYPVYPAGCYKASLPLVIPIPSSFQWLSNDFNCRMNIWAKPGFFLKKESGSLQKAIFLMYIISQVILGKEFTFILQQLDKYVYPRAIHIFPTLPLIYIPMVYFFLVCKSIWKAFTKQYYGQKLMLWDLKPTPCCKNKIVSLNRALRYLPTWVMMSLWDTCPFGSLASRHESAITISVKWSKNAKSAECRGNAAESEMQLSEQSQSSRQKLLHS